MQKKILILDDNADILEAVSLVLTMRKMDVVTLADPEKLDPFLVTYQPVLLLMDIALGAYDGRTLCRRLKNSTAYRNMPIILFTAQTYPSDSIEESGADAILNKPFRSQALFDEIERLLA